MKDLKAISSTFSSSFSSTSNLSDSGILASMDCERDPGILLAVSRTVNTLQPNSCPGFELANPTPSGYGLKKTFSATNPTFEPKHPDGIESMSYYDNSNPVEGIEKFIAISLVTGSVYLSGLDLASCDLLKLPSNKLQIYRRDIRCERHFYTDLSELREMVDKLVKEAQDSFPQADVKRTKVIAELDALTRQQERINDLLAAENADNDSKHLFHAHNSHWAAANLYEYGEICRINGHEQGSVNGKSKSLRRLKSFLNPHQQSANGTKASYSPKEQFTQAIKMFCKQIEIVGQMLKEDILIEPLLKNSKLIKDGKKPSLEELIGEYWNNPNLKVKFDNGSGQDFVVWCYYNDVKIDKTEPILAAHRKGRQIDGRDALIYAIDHDLRIYNKLYPLEWISSRASTSDPVEIENKNAIAWIAENRPEKKIQQRDIISATYGKIDSITWLAQNDQIINWQGKNKLEWVIDEWLKNPSICIPRNEGASPIIWAINRRYKINGLEATEWLKKESRKEVFETLIRANLKNHTKERINFIVMQAGREKADCIDDNSIIWMIKNLSAEKREMVLDLLQQVVKENGDTATHVGWLRKNHEFDLIAWLREKEGPDCTIEGKKLDTWLTENIEKIEPTKDDRNRVAYIEGMFEKFEKFWGKYGLDKLGGKEIPQSLETNIENLGFYYGKYNGDFWGAIVELKITEMPLILQLIEQIGKDKIFEPYGNNVNGKRKFDYGGKLQERAPLHWNARNLDIIKLLIENYGADPNVRTEDGSTIAHLVARNGPLEIMKYLAEKGADLSARDEKGDSVLQAAITGHEGNRDRLEVVRWLIKQDLQLEEYPAASYIPLVVKSPVRQDILIAKNFSNKTAVDIAEEKKLDDVLDILRQSMADRINSQLLLFLGMVWQIYDEGNKDEKISIVIKDPKAALEYAQQCSNTLSSYLPYLMGSSFYNRTQVTACGENVNAFYIMGWHNYIYPPGTTLGRKSTPALHAVQEVFKIIVDHGIVDQIPKSWQVNATSSLNNAYNSKENINILVITPQAVITRLREHVLSTFKDMYGAHTTETEINLNTFEKFWNVQQNTINKNLGIDIVIPPGKEKHFEKFYQEFIQQFKLDLKKKFPGQELDKLDSYGRLTRIYELLAEVQIKYGDNKGWRKQLTTDLDLPSNSLEAFTTATIQLLTNSLANLWPAAKQVIGMK